jgi:hypothetical protein
MGLDRRIVWIALAAILVAVVLSRLPALSSGIHSYPGDTARWAAPAVNYANFGVEHSYLPLVDQGDYGHLTADYYYRWPLLPFYAYGLWASVTSDETIVLRMLPLALHLVTLIYFFLLASLLFKRTEWALASTLLLAFIPGHFFLSVQISDTQWWVTAFIGATFHRIRYEQTGDQKHMAVHIGLLVLGCFCSWFGYLSVGAHFCLGIWSDIFSGHDKNWRSAPGRIFNRYRLILLGIAGISLAFQLVILYWLAGGVSIMRMSDRLLHWVTSNTTENQGLSVRIRKLVHWDLFLHLLVINGLFFAGYISIFANHASQPSHPFVYQQLFPIVAICAVLTIAVFIGYKFTGKFLLAATMILCLGLVTPQFIDYYKGRGGSMIDRRSKVELARSFGEVVSKSTLASDFVITNSKGPRGVPRRVTKYTSRRTLVFEVNEWDEISPYLEMDLIKGVVFFHQYDTPTGQKVDQETWGELTIRATRLGETTGLTIYRLK